MTALSVRDWLVRNTALEPSLLEGPSFDALVAERIAAVSAGDARAYVAGLSTHPPEVDRLIAGIAVPETWLFRYPRSFDVLADHLGSRLASGTTTLRMCSIGCATGQEPLCMAITALHAGWAPQRIAIDAIDRSPDALRIATQGRYSSASIRGEIPAWATPYLRHDGEWIRIDPIAQSCVRFSQGDASTWSAPQTLDVVFCRNLMIYMNAAVRTSLLSAIHDALVPGGLLFVGHAEMFTGKQQWRPVPAPHTFALERIETDAALQPTAVRAATPLATHAHAALATGRDVLPAPTPARKIPAGAMLDDARALADAGQLRESESIVRTLLAQHGPSAAALELLGLIRMAVNDAADAKRCFEQAVYLEPDRTASLLQLAVISERAGDARRAAAYWDRARRAWASAMREGSP
ncbi:MAG: hypothetical protein IT435_16730 [Phycisphaerales bacterium]|nr:hypothetical protein [Phycisphaerales bacterium]